MKVRRWVPEPKSIFGEGLLPTGSLRLCKLTECIEFVLTVDAPFARTYHKLVEYSDIYLEMRHDEPALLEYAKGLGAAIENQMPVPLSPLLPIDGLLFTTLQKLVDFANAYQYMAHDPEGWAHAKILLSHVRATLGLPENEDDAL